MLGEKISEETGRMSGRRVLPSEGWAPKVEVSFESQGTLLGVATNGPGTYWSVLRPDGTLYGEGQGVVMGAGGEAASWKARGLGRFTDAGGASWRGSVLWMTASEKWTSLNNVVGVFEFEQDADGNTQTTTWAWK